MAISYTFSIGRVFIRNAMKRGEDMGMLFRDMNKALSVKTCYSNFLLSSAVFMLTLLLSAALFIQDTPHEDQGPAPDEETALLD
ncbi:MAG: hypothetical protein P1U71_04780 [Sneathiella sp.]|nr:hypothetical protein [Sneathiella sp.]